jgi:DNA-binding NarL/FixJ family response regulator
LGEALLSSGRRPEAELALAAALEGARQIGARPLMEAIEVVVRGARLGPALQGGPVGARSATEGHAGRASRIGLTARERDVVRLVAAGHTNREIGDQLFISEKTVSVHVSNAMAKLGALSRYEAAAAAERQGLL